MAATTVPLGGLSITNPLAAKVQPGAYNQPNQVGPTPNPPTPTVQHANNPAHRSNVSGSVTANTVDTSGGGTTGPTPEQQQAAALQTKINELINTGTNAAQAGGAYGTAQGKQQLTGLGSNAVAAIGNQQATIDEARKEIGVTQINSIKQLINTIHNGLRGAGVQLGNTGALSSSARDAVSRAYANYGNVGTNTANNTAAVANQGQDVQQADLGRLISANKTQLDSARDTAVQAITAQAAQALDSLQTQITYMGGDPNSVPVQNIKDGIVQQAQSDLAQVDQNYQNMINGIVPATSDQTAQSAESASNAGVVPSSQTPFSSTNLLQNPTAQNTGEPTPSLIPLTLGPSGSSKTQTVGA